MSRLTDPTPPLEASSPTDTSPITSATPDSPMPAPGRGQCTKDHVKYCMDVLAASFERRLPMAPNFSDANDKL